MRQKNIYHNFLSFHSYTVNVNTFPILTYVDKENTLVKILCLSFSCDRARVHIHIHKSIHISQSDVWAAQWTAYGRTHTHIYTQMLTHWLVYTHTYARQTRARLVFRNEKPLEFAVCVLWMFCFMLSYPNCLFSYTICMDYYEFNNRFQLSTSTWFTVQYVLLFADMHMSE